MTQHNALATDVRIPPEAVDAARRRHAWLIEIIDRAVDASASLPFFGQLDEVKKRAKKAKKIKKTKKTKKNKKAKKIKKTGTIKDFAWTLQLFHHSRTLTRFIALVQYTDDDDEMMRFFGGHAEEERPHSGWLQSWMLEQGLITRAEEAYDHPPLPATQACIEFGHRLARGYDRDAWLVGVNCGIEKCSHTFFSKVEPVVRACLPKTEHHYYFEVHVEADQYHSTEALVFVPELDPGTRQARQLRDIALEGIELWCGMLNEWAGVSWVPQLAEDGSLIE